MTTKFLEPSAGGLRKPSDAQKENGQIINPPRFSEMGGLDKASRVAQKNPLSIRKPTSGRS